MDFKDQYCRGVFIIGVPFPPIQDLRVIGKQKYSESLMIYNEKTKTEEVSLSFKERIKDLNVIINLPFNPIVEIVQSTVSIHRSNESNQSSHRTSY